MLILHGENIVKSRHELIEIIQAAKQKGQEIIRLDGQKTSLTDAIQALDSQSLFGVEKFVVIENLLPIKSQEKNKIIDLLIKHQKNNLTWWEGKDITPSVLKKFPQAKIFHFKISPLIFKFLDSLKPDDVKKSLVLLKACQSQDEAEMIFYMLARQIRLLIQAKDKEVDKLLKMPFWQKNKLISQANKFSLNQLLFLHKQLTEIDYQQKVGQDPYNLSSRLDLFIASL